MRPQDPGCNPNVGHPPSLYTPAQTFELVSSHRPRVNQFQIANSGPPAVRTLLVQGLFLRRHSDNCFSLNLLI